MAVRPLVHVGYHKTATTWLQQELFTPTMGFVPLGERRAVIDLVVAPHPLHFDASVARGEFERWQSLSDQSLVPVVSMERLSGSPHLGRYDSVEIANRLAGALPTAQILVVVREQEDAILAGYRQYVKIGGARSLQEYLRPWRRWNLAHQFDLNGLDYHRLIGVYDELFGRDRVCVLPYEEFRTAPYDFVRKIIEFAGVPCRDETIRALPVGVATNRSLSPATISLKRRVNRVVARPSPFNPTPLIGLRTKTQLRSNRWWYRGDRWVPNWPVDRRDRRDRAVIREVVGDHYAEGNRVLSARMNVDLSTLGYDVGQETSQRPRGR